mmetsp:Transcript_5915/g.14236  ORF Transcript_5915/g.14236 Transcript_5915/m.14236 type:complete len:90 (-) Transcript_5915:22-291(-)
MGKLIEMKLPPSPYCHLLHLTYSHHLLTPLRDCAEKRGSDKERKARLAVDVCVCVHIKGVVLQCLAFSSQDGKCASGFTHHTSALLMSC